MHTLTFSEARESLKDVLDRVATDADYTIITRRDAADAVVMSLDTFNSWRETVYLLSSPANARHLARGIAALKAGRGKVRALFDAVTPGPAKVAERAAPYRVKSPRAKSRRAKPRG
jgi:antitoxin YefM